MVHKEGSVLFNTFYSYMVSDIVKDQLDTVKGPLLLPLYGLIFMINSKGSFICTIPQTGQYIPCPCNTSCRALSGTTNNSVGPPRGINLMTRRTISRYYHWGVFHSPECINRFNSTRAQSETLSWRYYHWGVFHSPECINRRGGRVLEPLVNIGT